MTKSSSQMKRVATASAVGTVIEFYDFTIFGIAAALVFNKIFFPALGGAAGTAVALATFGVAFVIRPFGAIFFGHFGDKFGRKNTLVATLLLMGVSTVGIGLIPSAETIGAWAPILLVALRCVQGLAMGGEWAGATVVTAEAAPEGRRGHYGMYPQLGPSLGFILSSATFLLTSLTMSDAEFLAWGWRVPFLASAVLIVVGFVARMALEEPKEFKSSVHEATEQKVRKLPVAELFREQSREVLLATGVTIAVFGLFYFVIVYLASYAVQTLKFARAEVLVVGMVGGVALAITTVLGASWSDKVGRRKVLAIGNGLCLVAALFLFPVLGLGGTAPFLVGVVVLQAGIGLAYGPLGAYLPELFSAQYRYTGAGLAYNLGTVLGGALTPIIASQLIERYGAYSVGLYIAGLCAVSLWALALSKETLRSANKEPSFATDSRKTTSYM